MKNLNTLMEKRKNSTLSPNESRQLINLLIVENKQLKVLMKGWSSYAWKDGKYIDDVQEYFDQNATLENA